MPDMRWINNSLQLEPYDFHRPVVRLVGDLESELPAHIQHRGVFLQHLAFDAFELLYSAIIANVHIVGTAPPMARRARPPPKPEATVTYCRPLCV